MTPVGRSERRVVTAPGSPRNWPINPPGGWDWDLWQRFRLGAIWEDEVPRDPDGRPLMDENGNPMPL